MLDFKTDEKRLFEFSVDGELFAVPTFDSFPVDDVIELVKEFKGAEDTESANERLTGYVRGLFDDHAPGVVERLTLGQWNTLVNAYVKASSADLGE